MRMQWHALAPAVVVLGLVGCGNEVVQPTVNVSVGQQLIDLKNARDSGALKEDEYRKQRKMLIDSVR
ncbi:MAG TPA: hypothetical protein VFU71_05250 [Burkholderiaceae bacterium]|nr:hypothetical protein [Burkholderiaceae bacterium]